MYSISTHYHRAALAAAMAILFVIVGIAALPAAQAVLQPGDSAPEFVLKDSAGKSYRLDTSSKSPALLVFVKPADRYTSEALHALDHLFTNQPELEKGLDRWIISSRMGNASEAKKVEAIAGGRWPVLLDTDDRVYHKYLIIATPTVVLIGSDRKVAAVNPGYDLGMENHLRKELAKALGLAVPQEAKEKSATEAMTAITLQMGRRMAARGLYERALIHYEKAAKEGPLSPEAQAEMAEIYIELRQPDQALEILKPLQSNPNMAPRVNNLIQRAEALKQGKAIPGNAPKVTH